MSNDFPIVATASFATESISVRYPVLASYAESPHRFYVSVESLWQAFWLFVVAIFVELFIIFCMPGFDMFGVALGVSILVAAVGIRVGLRNTRITISNDGISFPFLMIKALNGRCKRSWGDIQSVDLHLGKNRVNTVRGHVLSISFKSGGQVDLDVSRMSKKDVIAFSDKLYAFADPKVIAAQVSDLVSRNELEALNTRSFVFAKEHRKLLSENFGFANAELHAVGAAFFDSSYIIEKQLSMGGNLSSYLVSDVKRGQTLKMTEYSLAMLTEKEKINCLAELNTVASNYVDLQIPHIFNLVEVRSSDDCFFVFSEPEGRSLREAVYKAALSEHQVIGLALALAKAVQATTVLGLPLSGIKPDAITYGADGTTVIGEFGFVDDVIGAHSNLILQDAPYAAPERLAGQATPASDLYSIGAVMYFALTAQDPPSFGSSSARLANRKLSEHIDRLIVRLLGFEPDDRGSVAELLHDVGGSSLEKIAVTDHV